MEMKTTAKSFLVKYLNHAKKIENPTEENIRQLFYIEGNKNIFIQFWDREFEAFVDVNWSDIFRVDSKILRICEELELVVPQNRPCDLERGDTLVLNKENYQKNFSCSNLEKDIDLSLGEQYSVSDASIIKDSSDSGDDNLELKVIEISSNIEIKSTPPKNKKIRIDKDPLLFSTSSPKIISCNPYVINLRSSSMEIIDQSKISSPSCFNTDANDDGRPKKDIKQVYPTSYVLPTINPASRLGMALKNEESIHSKSLKGEFLMKIYKSFTANKKFYVEEGYEEIVNAILNAYPYLGEGLSHQDAKHYWAKSLQVKFCNERQRTDHSKEPVKMKKKHCKSIDASGLTTPKETLKSSVLLSIPNYCPSISLCDKDEISVDSQKKWMKSEMKEAEKNISGISLRMDMTFKQRRSLLFTVEDGTPTNNISSDILKEYPCLRIEDQAISEVTRLFGTNEKYEKYLKCIYVFSQKINDLVCSSKSIFKPYMDGLFSFGNSLNHEDYILYKLIGNISVLLGEDPKEIISSNLNETHCPMLHLDNGLVNVNVDGASFITGVSSRTSSFLWIGAFYIFNVQPVSNRKSFDVLQYLFFDIPERISKFPQGSVKIIQLFKKICVDALHSNPFKNENFIF